jgi:hypothetical protein
MSTLGLMPSLAQSTSTHLDSACKHIQQCRVSQDHMTKFLHHSHSTDPDELIRNKYRYCVHKDELVLGVGKCWAKDGSDKKFQNNAYPRVVSNLGGLADMDGPHDSPVVKLIKVMYHNATSIPERERILEKFQNARGPDFGVQPDGTNADKYLGACDRSGKMHFAEAVPKIYDFISVGYANTLGWAHAHTGDTMTSVMIGGLRTVMNGDFEVFTGDLIQWYWPFERMCFNKKGARKPRVLLLGTHDPDLNLDPCTIEASAAAGVNWSLDKDSLQRKQFFDQQYGDRKGRDKVVAQIKPYKRDDDAPRIYDWYRVFAVALCSARPREKVDIRICRQAL